MQQSRFETVQFRARAADPATEVFLIDASLSRIGSAVGQLEADVSPGFYKVRFRAGASQHDELVEVSGEEATREVIGEPVLFRSAAPILNTTTFDADQAGLAADWSREPQSIGDGAELFVFLREEDAKKAFDPEGVSVHDLKGAKVVDLSAGRIEETARCAGICLRLDPGTYRLRVSKAGLGDYEIFVTLSPDWQVQVFLAFETFTKGEVTVRAASLRRSAIFMRLRGMTFDPEEPNTRLTELAKQALLQGRNIVSDEMINRFLHGKFQDPMMGLFAAHILLATHPRNRDLIAIVLMNLGRLIGETSDLAALRLAARKGREAKTTIESPPLLAASWRSLTKATRQNASLIAPMSVPGQIAHNIADGGAWLLHRVSTDPEARPQSLAHSEAMFREMLMVPSNMLQEVVADRRSTEEFSGLEQSLLSILTSRAAINDMFRQVPEAEDSEVNASRQIWRLPAPAYSVAAAVQSLDRKLGILKTTDRVSR
ncbi:hypothetical protein [Roseovarius sp. D22-M7]|uniref:hypothetical protein n=1 Tax=Roseovarius sp. D22-M7 TaxID=3127116 RepID=UPI00301040FB